MTRLKCLRKATGLKLREVAKKVGVTPSTVHDAEIRGVRTPRTAVKFAVAFPGHTWHDLLEEPGATASH
ncbi:helix-turn-helix transcriptional regulator [uncultured Victivallis sp.]|uniref:helix-turn-helix transcriptional regulator n=1 Tax=uncultured Victivallis sp. TaxID=354118 RepID=UPI00131A4B84|nr:helix-turn-helix transcriptional regulator [uncultured Victivallis sp.]